MGKRELGEPAFSDHRAAAAGWARLSTEGVRRCLDMETDRLLFGERRALSRVADGGENPTRPPGRVPGRYRPGCSMAYDARRSWTRIELFLDNGRSRGSGR